MGYSAKLNTSAVTFKSRLTKINNEIIYMDGRFSNDPGIESAQVSIETVAASSLFAISDRLVDASDKQEPRISLVDEINKIHTAGVKANARIDTRLSQLAECVEVTNNLLHTMHLGKNDAPKSKASFAGLLLSGNNAAALGMGKSAVCLYRKGALKTLAPGLKKMEKLAEMGIVEGRTEGLPGQAGVAPGISESNVWVSDIIRVEKDDLFIICSDGFLKSASDLQMKQILENSGEVNPLVMELIKSAAPEGEPEDMTVIAVKVEGFDEPEGDILQNESVFEAKPRNISKRRENINTIIASVVTLLLIAGLAGVFYLLWNDIGKASGSKQEDTVTAGTSGNNSASDKGAGNAQSSSDRPSQSTGQQSSSQQGTTAQNAGTGSTSSKDGTQKTDTVKYEVQAGDTLQKISSKFYNDPNKYKQIMERNNIQNENQLKIGQILIIP